MNKLLSFCPIILFVIWQAIPANLHAQFNDGVALLTEAKLIHKAWHLNSKLPGNPILKVSGNSAWANDNVLGNASTFVVEPGADDGDWWSADKRWFHLRNVATGLYLTVQGSGMPRSVGLEQYDETDLAQKFRLIATIDPGWYKLRSHLSTGVNNPDLVLEIGDDGQLIAGSPKADPSAEQKFAFNLALPKGEFRYTVINSSSGQFVSDNGLKTGGNYLVHKKKADQSCIFKFIPIPGHSPYYYIRAELTGQNANNLLNAFITMHAAIINNDFNYHWEVLRSGENYLIRNRFNSLYLLIGDSNPAGSPLVFGFGILGGEWAISPVPEEPTVAAEDYERIEEGDAPPSCVQIFGENFKRALTERIGLNPANAGQHFQFIQDALAARYGVDRVPELLRKFELDNPGHRADLGLTVRYYFTEVLADYHPAVPWPAPAQAAALEYAAKIQALRIDYAERLQDAWADHVENNQSAATGFSGLFYSVSEEGFIWPTMYNPQGSQESLINEYATAAGNFADYSPPTLGGGLSGLSAALGAVHVMYGPSLVQANSFVQVAAHFSVSPAVASANASVPASTFVSASVAPIAVAITAITAFAVQLTAGLELEEFLDNLNDRLTWAQNPVDIRGVLTSPNMLEATRLLSDLDFVIGAPVVNGFAHNLNDNISTPPFTVQCPASVTLNLNAQGTATLTTGLILGNQVIILNCGTPIEYFIASQIQYNCDDLGVNNDILFVARNEIGGDVYAQVCTLDVLVADPIEPAVTCKNATVHLNGLGMTTLAPQSVFQSGSDNCGTVNLVSVTPNQFDCGDLGNHTVTLKVNDGNGKEKTCQATVTVVDNTPPVAICPPVPIAIGLDANGQATLLPSQIGGISTDNCQSSLTFTMSKSTFTCSDFGFNTVTLTAKDGSNNSAACLVNFIVSDPVKPVALCKPATVFLDANGTATLTPAVVDNGSSDACGIQSLVLSKTTFGCADVGTVTVTLTVRDFFQNEKTCTANVSVVDNANPTALCKNATVQLDASGNGTLAVTAVNSGSSDACGIQSLVLSKTSFNCSNVGANTVTLTVSDNNGKTATCTATVTVQDNVAPTAICKNATVQLDATGNGTLAATAVNNGSSDACGIQSLALSKTTFDCSNIGANTVSLTVGDINGNSKICTATVTVQDKVVPVAICQNISIQLDATGNKTIAAAQVFQSGSDNCGTVNIVSLSPSQFDCGEIGANTVTLMVNDGHGNTNTCTATVTVQPFLSLTNTAVTHESCAGMGNGFIVINATAPGGTLMYSINGGASYSTSNAFNNLPPGTYSLKVLAQGTSGCTVSGSATVNAGGGTQTWYKDTDNDGYSDGITQQSCNQPTGYKLAANLLGLTNDCNDSDPLQFPGQIWYKDVDNDGYSDGQNLVQCSKPTGYKTAASLVATTGDCQDGTGTVPGYPAAARSNIHPGAAETCNGLDDDCDGVVDDGVAGSPTYVGNVTITTQAQANAFPSCYSVIQGNLTIQNSGIDSLPGFVNLLKVTGSVTIKLTGLDSLSWLMNLDTISGSLTIQQNTQLSTLHGLDSLKSVGAALKVFQNFNLADCCAIHELLNSPGAVGGTKTIALNKTGCDNLNAINVACAGGNNLIAPPGCTGCLPISQGLALQEEERIVVFPNPASHTLNVRLESYAGQTASVSIVNAQGVVVQEEHFEILEENPVSLSLERLKDGMYWLYIQLEDGREQGIRFVLNR